MNVLSPTPEESTPLHHHQFELYSRRWIMLLAMSGLNFVSNVVFVTMVPVERTARSYYQLSSFEINLPTLVSFSLSSSFPHLIIIPSLSYSSFLFCPLPSSFFLPSSFPSFPSFLPS
jgi:hypothetical protein